MSGEANSERGREARRGFVVSGRVQGVGFRWSTARRAGDLGLRGTVRNRTDGTVEVHVAGDADAVERLRSWLEKGPRAARVDDLSEIDPGERLPDDFRIVR